MDLFKNIMPQQLAIAIVSATTLAAAITVSEPVQAKSKRYTVEADYCKKKDANGNANPCAALVYGNAGGYSVNKVFVKARGTQQWDQNPNCTDLVLDSTMDVRVTEYGVFIVPASCSYKLTIKIGGGDSKSQHVFMTPGCQLVLESKGTTLNNNTPKVKSVKWTDKAKDKLSVTKLDAVDDSRWHAALANAGVPGNSEVVHYCNKDDKGNNNPN